MSLSEHQGLIKKGVLTEAEIAEIAQLVALCNEHDGLRTRIPLEALRKRSGDEIEDFLYYEQGVLVGYLYVDSWGKKEREITGVVAPDFRRRGIARQLFEAACIEYKARGVECIVVVCEQSSHSGHAFAKAVRAKHDFAEHEMILGNFIERNQLDPEFQMRPATLDDKEALVTILATDMGNEEDARQMVEKIYQTSAQQPYLATLAGKPLGTLRLDEQGETVGIYGFVVHSKYRKRGYGRQMLEYIIRRIQDMGPRTIMLEVETENHNAVGLYTSCGFQIKTTYEYYKHNL
ncbi:MAG: GNAT family N-acetyltransferase [Ktedonobacteraceae bacterium]